MSGLAIGEDILCVPSGRNVMISSPTGQVALSTGAPPELDAAPVRDDLRELIYRCLAQEPDERPSPDELLRYCENAVYTKTASDFIGLPDGKFICETDFALRQTIQELMLNADQDENVERLRGGRRRTIINPMRQWRRQSIVPLSTLSRRRLRLR
ncbi:hypothetical protein F5Y15DRAFT_392605 [Xylariaceae sp. FL0016]|nr:hypothetical protein F5Y15DRAFT_392605 [Xylariaceae sp. FL0016]